MSARAMGPPTWLRSVPHAVRDLVAGRTHCVSAHLGEPLRMSDGRTYTPFRHTVKDAAHRSTSQAPTVLQPRFHLRFMGPRRRRLHSLFRVVCIVTTLFFVGLPGFRSKLWMVDPVTGDFAGLYEWDGGPNAGAYVEGLAKVLRLRPPPGRSSTNSGPR